MNVFADSGQWYDTFTVPSFSHMCEQQFEHLTTPVYDSLHSYWFIYLKRESFVFVSSRWHLSNSWRHVEFNLCFVMLLLIGVWKWTSSFPPPSAWMWRRRETPSSPSRMVKSLNTSHHLQHIRILIQEQDNTGLTGCELVRPWDKSDDSERT